MLPLRQFVAALIVLASAGVVSAQDAPKRLLFVTHSGGFIHDALGVAEDTLKEIGPKHGFEVTCFRFTGDPKKPIKQKDGTMTTALEDYSARFRKSTGKTVELDSCGRLTKETLAKFDVVLFYTTGDPVNDTELQDLLEWVKAGGAFAGTHCASDTLYKAGAYGELVGAYFDGHPWHQKVKLKVEDPAHAAAKGFQTGSEITDEIYQFRPQPYSRDKLHIILSIDNSSIDVKKGKRADQDYAVAWCREYGQGRSFYTSLGHRKEVWKDPRFQEHLLNGLKWTLKLVPGSAAPSAAPAK